MRQKATEREWGATDRIVRRMIQATKTSIQDESNNMESLRDFEKTTREF